MNARTAFVNLVCEFADAYRDGRGKGGGKSLELAFQKVLTWVDDAIWIAMKHPDHPASKRILGLKEGK